MLDSDQQSISRPEFKGSAAEYFRIWIVNMLLSIVTFGIYSAWATVRNRRYLYGNVELDGARFDFHGEALAILKGRVIAVALFAAYAFGGDFHYLIPLLALLLLVAGFPWVLVSALRFRLSNTSYRNLRFASCATARQAYSVLAGPVLAAVAAYVGLFAYTFLLAESEPTASMLGTFLLIMLAAFLLTLWLIPAMSYRARDLILNHMRYGDHDFRAVLKQGLFYSAYLKAIGLGIVAFIVAGIAAFLVTVGITPLLHGFDQTTAFFISLVVFYVMIVLGYLLPFAYWRVAVANHAISGTSLDRLLFRMAMRTGDYWLILITNALAAVASLGLAIPWAKVRMLRYKLACFSVAGELGDFTGASGGTQAALGDQVGDAFDIDMGF